MSSLRKSENKMQKKTVYKCESKKELHTRSEVVTSDEQRTHVRKKRTAESL